MEGFVHSFIHQDGPHVGFNSAACIPLPVVHKKLNPQAPTTTEMRKIGEVAGNH